VIKSQTKAKKRSLGWEKSRSPKARAMTGHNRDKMLHNCWLHKVRQKGLDTIGKRAQLKFRRKRAPKCMNASSPWRNASLPICLPLMQNSTWKHELGTFPPPCL
jgi:hypothetical protein